MLEMENNNYIGGKNWSFSDKIYSKLTAKNIKSNYFPVIPINIKEIHGLFSEKKIFGFFWSTPTFKDTDCHYLFHVYDETSVDFIITTSSANTVESMARATKRYNQEKNKNVNTILLVPEISYYKVAKKAIEDNPYIKYIVLKNSTLDSIREFASKLKEAISKNYNVVSADADLKTAAYSQIGRALNNIGLMNEDTCFVQTVSGGVGPTGFIESAYELKTNPEILVVQPKNGKSNPIIDALNEHAIGNDPFTIFNERSYETSKLEPTLGSTRPMYAIRKYIEWREKGGRILTSHITENELLQYKEKILDALIESGVYPNKEIGLKMFDLEKSGFISFVGAIKTIKKIESNTIIINFTGRYLNGDLSLHIPANPHFFYNPSNGIEKLLDLLKIN